MVKKTYSENFNLVVTNTKRNFCHSLYIQARIQRVRDKTCNVCNKKVQDQRYTLFWFSSEKQSGHFRTVIPHKQVTYILHSSIWQYFLDHTVDTQDIIPMDFCLFSLTSYLQIINQSYVHFNFFYLHLLLIKCKFKALLYSTLNFHL